MRSIQKQAGEAWQRYCRRGHISHNLLRPHIYRAWERSHLQKASPHHMKAEQLSQLETARLLGEKSDLIEAARPYMQALSDAAGMERHAAMLGDENAIVLDIVADAATAGGAESFPGPGSILNEALSGANGIGTPLAEGGYAELVATEHFIQGFHPFTCQGVPVLGVGNRVVGVLSTSVRRLEASLRLQEITIVAAQGIEAELQARHLESISKQIAKCSQLNEDILGGLRQDITQAHTIGRMNMELAAAHLNTSRARDDMATGNELLKSARMAMERFRMQSALCLDLASNEPGLPEPVDVADLLERLSQLLETEMRIRKVELVKGSLDPLIIFCDRKELQRGLLHFLLKSIQASQGLGLRIDLVPAHSENPAKLALTLTDGENVRRNSQEPIPTYVFTQKQFQYGI